MKLKIPPALVTFFFLAVMWGINYFAHPDIVIFSGMRWVVVFLLGCGGLLGTAALVQFYRNATTVNPHSPENANTLVTGGVYRISRNPMYLALLLLLIGYGFFLGNSLTFFVPPFFVAYMNRYQIIPEEVAMEERFGAEYSRYKSQVRRWL